MIIMSKKRAAFIGASLIATLLATTAVADGELDSHVATTLKTCQHISTSCASTTTNAAGILVFPSVVKADLIIGGAGGKGALIENGKITGYYSIGAGTAGLEAGIDKSSEVYVFRSAHALAQLKNGSGWHVGAGAGVTVVNADANTQGSNGDVDVYVFDAQGLHGDVAVSAFDIWKSGSPRPSSQQ